MPRNQDHLVLERRPWRVPAELPFGDGTLVPMCAGEDVAWQIAAPTTA